MAITINVNGLTLCHQGSGGVSRNTLPDVCKTPDKGIPLPYQNEAYSRDLVKGTVTVFADGGCSIANDGSQFAKSVFDEAGSMGGVASGTHLAETDWISHSFTVFFEKKPACRLTDKLFMNHRNTANLAGLKQKALSAIPPWEQGFAKELCDMACVCIQIHKKGGYLPLPTGPKIPGESPIRQYQECVRAQIDIKYYEESNNIFRIGKHPRPGAPMWREVSFSKLDHSLKYSADVFEQTGRKVPSSWYPITGTYRLDVVMVDPSGRMLKMYDMKFFEDGLDDKTAYAYKAIALLHTGNQDNFIEFKVDDLCDCREEESKESLQALAQASESNRKYMEKLGLIATESSMAITLLRGLLRGLAFILSRGRTGVPR